MESILRAAYNSANKHRNVTKYAPFPTPHKSSSIYDPPVRILVLVFKNCSLQSRQPPLPSMSLNRENNRQWELDPNAKHLLLFRTQIRSPMAGVSSTYIQLDAAISNTILFAILYNYPEVFLNDSIKFFHKFLPPTEQRPLKGHYQDNNHTMMTD